MQKTHSKKQSLARCTAFFIAVFAISYTLTALTPLIADDYNYAFSWADGTRVDNLTLVIKSMITHRQWTHGRVFAQGWVTIFMMWPKWVFSLANAAVVTVFYVALYHFFQRAEAEKPLLACSAVAALYWICMPAFGQVFLWLDGACNYFWGAALAWILIELEQSIRNRSEKWAWLIGLLPLAFAAGAWSEHISFAMLMILFLLLLLFWATEKKFPLFDSLILFASCAGYLFLMLAPSMLPTILKIYAIRAIGFHLQTITTFFVSHWWLLPFIAVILALLWLWRRKVPNPRTRCVALCMVACGIDVGLYFVFAVKTLAGEGIFSLISSTQTSFLLLLACFLYVLGKAYYQEVSRDVIAKAVILSFGGLSALALFAVAFYVPARGFCAPVVFVGIATVKLWTALKFKKTTTVRTAIVAAFLVCFALGVADILTVYQAARERENAIQQAKQTDGVLVAMPYPFKTKYSAQYGLLDLEDGESWPNDIIQEYYGLKSIVVVSETGKG